MTLLREAYFPSRVFKQLVTCMQAGTGTALEQQGRPCWRFTWVQQPGLSLLPETGNEISVQVGVDEARLEILKSWPGFWVVYNDVKHLPNAH